MLSRSHRVRLTSQMGYTVCSCKERRWFRGCLAERHGFPSQGETQLDSPLKRWRRQRSVLRCVTDIKEKTTTRRFCDRWLRKTSPSYETPLCMCVSLWQSICVSPLLSFTNRCCHMTRRLFSVGSGRWAGPGRGGPDYVSMCVSLSVYVMLISSFKCKQTTMWYDYDAPTTTWMYLDNFI